MHEDTSTCLLRKRLNMTLRVHFYLQVNKVWLENLQKKIPMRKLIRIGRGEKIRTPGPMVPNHVRYQTALHPVTITCILYNFYFALSTLFLKIFQKIFNIQVVVLTGIICFFDAVFLYLHL